MERTELLLVNVSFLYYLFPIFLVSAKNTGSGLISPIAIAYLILGSIAIIILIDTLVLLFVAVGKAKTFSYRVYAGLICFASAYLVVQYLAVNTVWYLFFLPILNVVNGFYVLYDVRKKFKSRPHYAEVILGLLAVLAISFFVPSYDLALSIALIYALNIHRFTAKYINRLFLLLKNPA